MSEDTGAAPAATPETDAPAAPVESAEPPAPPVEEPPTDRAVGEPDDAGGMVFRAAPAMVPGSVDQENRTVDVVMATGHPVRRYDWRADRYVNEVLDISPKSIRLERMNGGAAPLLASHMSWSLDSVLGRVVPGSVRVEKGQLVGRVKFGTGEAIDEIFRNVAAGTMRNCSVGYLVHRMEVDEDSDPVTHRVIDWEPIEISAVPIGADPNSGFRAFTRATPPAIERTDTMADQVKSAGAVPAENRNVPENAPENSAAPAPDANAIRAAILKDVAEKRALAKRLRLPDEMVERHINEGTTMEAFRAAAIEEIAKRDEKVQTLPIQPPPRVPAEARGEAPKGANVSRIIMALGATKGMPREAAAWAERQWGDAGMAVARALAASIGSTGGFAVPEAMSGEIIELLRPRSTVMSLGPSIIDMPNGNFTLPGLATGAAASYIGENENIPKTEPTFRQVKLSAKKLAALVPISNDMFRYTTAANEMFIRNDLVAALAQRADLAFLRGAGTEYTPRGLRSWAQVPAGNSNFLSANGTVNLANVTNDLGRMELALMNANVPMAQPGWIMAPRTQVYLANLRDGNGNLVYAEEMARGTLRGKPFRTTTQIPVNLGSGTDESEIYLADFAEVIIGETLGLIIDVSSEAAYHDGSAVQAAFSLDQTVIRAIIEHDMAMRQAAAIVVMTAVKWIPA